MPPEMKAMTGASRVRKARASRRGVLFGLVSSLLLLPFGRFKRIERSGFVERGGWILKRSDVE
ncbi:hypothetical protein [Fulvimarina manganoxydans]|uniref:hypothetical protein n=1 Tax=Fulvimarina manganoxydans TaxID=937218 RepID=UPI0023536863|nr:hypothetical protein [Fulvimarina manganoxydans]